MQEKQSSNSMNENKNEKEKDNKCCSSSTTWIRGKCIGKGSFATVNLAINTTTNNLFAVKSVPLNNKQQLTSLESEINILKNLSSPYIINYLNDDVSQNHRNLHLEYLPDGDLASRPPAVFFSSATTTTRHFTRCLLLALQYLHSNNIVHCDVKGKNVLLQHNNVKLADFGSAKKMGLGGKNVMQGSPLWMAPEVVRGEYQGPESDVWSLGCTVIEMVKGKPAWEESVDFDVLWRIGYSEDELPEIPEEFCEEGRDFLDKCLRRDKCERWSCEELLKHPFVRRQEDSPRCVFDWVGSEFDVLDDYGAGRKFDTWTGVESEFQGGVAKGDGNLGVNGGLDLGFCGESAARGRIGKLASILGANWEMDGWVDVRICSEEDGTSFDCRRVEMASEVSSLGYSNFGGILTEENRRVEEEYERAFSEFHYSEGFGGGWNWECKLEDVENKFYKFCENMMVLVYCYYFMKPRCNLLFLFFLLFVYFLLHILLLASSFASTLNYLWFKFKVLFFNLLAINN